MKVKGFSYIYLRGENVLASWPGSGYFAAHITGYSKGKYKVYFPADNKTRVVPENEIRKTKKNMLWAKVTRLDVKDFEFTHEKNRYIVKKIGIGKNLNKYMCESYNSAGIKTGFAYFYIGNIMKKYLKKLHPKQFATRTANYFGTV